MTKRREEQGEAPPNEMLAAGEEEPGGDDAMDTRNSKAFDYAKGLTTQLLTLSTGTIALTLTFSKTFLGEDAGAAKILLAIGWLLFLLSILAGLFAWMGMTSQLSPSNAAQARIPTIWKRAVRVPAIFQCLLFLAAVGVVIAAGAIAL